MNDNINKKWYVTECFSGESCWCRTIVTDPSSDELEDCIVPSGSIGKDVAQHIVELHNIKIKFYPDDDSQ